jgi:cytochrome c-type biogenesis protein CcmE
MNRIRTKLIVAGLVLAGAVSYLAFAGVKSGWVYMVEVEQYLADEQFRSQRVRIHGTVGGEELVISRAGLTASFRLHGTGGAAERSLPVVYRGNVPEMFGAEKSVVVEGRCDASGVFQADVLMTKCASKYEPNSPHAENGQ